MGKSNDSTPRYQETAMNTLSQISTASVTPAGIEAIMLNARIQRAEAMRSALSQLPGLFKQLAARLHLGHGTHAGALAH
jgi:hypothetical protein